MWVIDKAKSVSITDDKKPEASDDIALWLADEFTQVSDLCYTWCLITC